MNHSHGQPMLIAELGSWFWTHNLYEIYALAYIYNNIFRLIYYKILKTSDLI